MRLAKYLWEMDQVSVVSMGKEKNKEK